MMLLNQLVRALTYAQDKRHGQALKAVIVDDEHYHVLAHDMDQYLIKKEMPIDASTLGKMFVRGVEVFKHSDVLDLRDDT